jgi:N-acetylneuraminic acid mutarotase
MHQRLIASMLASSVLGLFHPPAHAADLSFEGRVRAQEAIERVYYSHRIGTTRPFEEAVPRTMLETKVERYLALSTALDLQWHSPINAEALSHEAERIAQETRLPDRLLEIYAALGNDPDVIMECFVRPILVERMARSFFDFDPVIHARARRDADQLAAQLRRSGMTGATTAEVHEDADAFRVSVHPTGTPGDAALETYTVAKRGWDDWLEENRPQLRTTALAVGLGLEVPRPHSGGSVPTSATCPPDNAWFQVYGNNPEADGTGVAVWTGTHMLTWGGKIPTAGNKGSKYDPTINFWVALLPTPNTPSSRNGHSAVWTGSRMIIWGGNSASGAFLGDGAGYDPQTDSWTPISSVGAPTGRQGHTAVWTGTRMVVWGGLSPGISHDTGGRYDPQTNTWAATSTAGAPLARWDHMAVWSGSKMIVWGGWNGGTYYDSGGRYDPQTDTWTATSTLEAPSPRLGATALWTGSQMIVWGGYFGPALDSGGRYDPVADIWLPTSTTGAPTPRGDHSAVWTGSRMIVWGGKSASAPPSPFNDGGRYDPVSDSWMPVSAFGNGAYKVKAVWSGTWVCTVGGRYDPSGDTWVSNISPKPPDRKEHTAVWTGAQMIVWGGFDNNGNYLKTGNRYDPVVNVWTSTSMLGAPSARTKHTAVWTGSRMVIWGGSDANPFGVNSGARYDPIGDTWTPTSTTNAPSARALHSAVWTGSRMIVWGGQGGTYLNTGGLYDPVADTWNSTATAGAPVARQEHTAIWTGQRMIVWGGLGLDGKFSSGGIYDPTGNAWTLTAVIGAPEGRIGHTAVWTGSQMLIWGGFSANFTYLNSGGAYSPLFDTWSSIPLQDAPSGRTRHTTVWTGSRMIVWGGYEGAGVATGGRYRPSDSHWEAISTYSNKTFNHTAVWTGQYMIVWGGHPIIDMPAAVYASDESPNADNDSFTVCAGDCNDSNSAVYPSAPQLCDGVNNNCADPAWPAVPANEADSDADGHRVCQGDCNDNLSSAWAMPGEVQALLLSQDPDSGVTTLAWSTPAAPGGTAIVYDALRAVAAGDFISGTACVASDASATTAAESAVPSVGGTYFYLVRAENGCPGLTGQGVLGTDSEGTPQPGVNCP